MGTRFMLKKIEGCEDMAEFQLLMRDNPSMNRAWAEYYEAHIRPLRTKMRLTDNKLAAGIGKGVTTVRNFRETIPHHREQVIMLAMMLGLSVADTNDLLVRGAKYPALYSRNPEDATWSYLLEKGASNAPAALFEAYWEVYKEECGLKDNTPQPLAKGTRVVRDEIQMAARRAKEVSVASASSDEVYRNMIRSHMHEFNNAYWRLEEFIDRKFRGFRISPNQMWENHEKFRSVYYDRMHALREDRKVPDRMFLVALGIHLELDHEDIDKMLKLAGMAPLYARDRLEASVIHILEDLSCRMPSVFSRNGNKEKCIDGRDELDENGQPLVKDDEPLCDYFARELTRMGLEDRFLKLL